MPADITGVSCESGEVDASVFDRYRTPLCKGVENTIRNIGRLSRDGMKETDKEIIKMMCD